MTIISVESVNLTDPVCASARLRVPKKGKAPEGALLASVSDRAKPR
ncbi:MAG: hypothetical protein ABW220_00800 [Burkholderiaceae bacterium]